MLLSWERSHRRWERGGGPVTCTFGYGITSLPAADLLALLRGHWRVESANHSHRDKTFGEDASRVRTSHGPSNATALKNLALALLQPQQLGTLPEAQTYYGGNRAEALQLLLEPT